MEELFTSYFNRLIYNINLPNVVEDILTAGDVVVFEVVRCVLTFNKLAVVGSSVEDFIDKVDDDVGNGEVFGISVELGSFFVSLMLDVADVLISLDGVLVSKVFRVLSDVVVSCSVDDDNATGVVGMTLLICESILSAFASIISKPALMRSKKLLSVVDGRDLNGGRVDDATVVVEISFSSCFGSSDPNNNEKKSIVSPSSSISSSSSCRDCRLNFNERRRQS